MALEFSDGVTFDTSGKLRIEHRHDGAYVVGNGRLVPVRDEAEGKATIARMEARRRPARGAKV